MDITGEHRIAVPREEAWAALFDIETLKACIPGCKELEQTSPTTFEAKVQLKIGPVSASFAGTVALQDIDAPNGCRIVGQGNGGIAGFAKGSADVKLVADCEETLLRYDAKAEIGGKIAALGSRLVQATVRKIADQFFSALTDRLRTSSRNSILQRSS